jgi:hypothetical protein
VTDKRFKLFVGACILQILGGLGLGLSTTASPQWVGFLIAACGAAEIVVFGWSRRRTPTE